MRVFRRGRLVKASTTRAAGECLLVATANGSVAVVSELPELLFRFFARLQSVLRDRITPLGHSSHRDFRLPFVGRPSPPAERIIDGDLIAQFLELAPAARQEIAADMGLPLEEVALAIEQWQQSLM
jgi:hypothetical protein